MAQTILGPQGGDRASREGRSGRSRFVSNLVRDLAAGLIVGTLVAVVTISLASFIVAGELAHFRGDAVTLFLVTSFLLGTVVALRSSVPGAIGVIQDIPAAVLATVGAALIATLPSREAAFATLMAAAAITGIATGAVYLLVGALRLGSVVRFVPYPVVGGFLAGTGTLLLAGGIEVMSGVAPSIAALGDLFSDGRWLLWTPGVALAAATVLIGRATRSPLVFPGLVALSTLVFYGIMAATGGSVAGWREGGFLLGPFPEGAGFRPLAGVSLADVDLGELLRHSGAIATVVLLSLLALLFNATGLEAAVGRPVGFDRELRAAGLGNLLSGALGGTVGYHGLGFSTLIRRIGSGGRRPAFIALSVLALAALAGTDVLELVPTFIVGGVLAYLGLLFLLDWLVATATNLPPLEYGIVLAITIGIVVLGFLPGIALGLALAVVLFIVTYSRVDAIRLAITGSEATSRVVRAPAERQLLAQLGGATLVLQLQGFLFFGSAYAIVERVKRAIAAGEGVEHVVLDFHRVYGMDATAAASFRSLAALAEEGGFTMVCSGLSPAVARHLERSGVLAAPSVARHVSQDLALEWCERRLLERVSGAAVDAAPDAASELALELQGLLPYLERQEVPEGSTLVAQGDPADVFFVVASGRVSAVLGSDPATRVRLETMEGGALVGEIGFYTRSPRGATVIADAPSVVYALRRERLEELSQSDPALAAEIHRFVAHRLAERSTHLLRVVTALQR
jgi:sulfate permease, SulP family